jgi:hypothetical protein
MRIKRVASYIVGGKSFDSEEKARRHIFDKLGETVDRLCLQNIVLGPGDRIKLVESMFKNASELVAILDGCNAAPEGD